MTGAASARLRWAVAVLDPRPGDRVLEVGCGHGVAVALVCERLEDGAITAVDRSEKMIAAARKRTAACGEKVRLVCAPIEEADLGDEAYDKVFAVHVAALHGPGRPLEAVRERLVSGGRLYVFNQAPGWRTKGDAASFSRALREGLPRAGFEVAQTRVELVGDGIVAAVVASRR